MHDLPDRLEDWCRRCDHDVADCTCFGPANKWGGLKQVTFNAGRMDRPIFQTINAFVFGEDTRHLHIQMPGDAMRKIAIGRVIMIDEVPA